EHIGSLYAAIGYSNEVIHCFIASELVVSESATEPDEFIELVHATFDEAIAMVLSGEICDMKSVAALLLANARRVRA
ncbi:MAG TPA: NUDIX hydrolase, partial [Rhodothermales bacterium]